MRHPFSIVLAILTAGFTRALTTRSPGNYLINPPIVPRLLFENSDSYAQQYLQNTVPCPTRTRPWSLPQSPASRPGSNIDSNDSQTPTWVGSRFTRAVHSSSQQTAQSLAEHPSRMARCGDHLLESCYFCPRRNPLAVLSTRQQRGWHS